jgi:hypothetical protein
VLSRILLYARDKVLVVERKRERHAIRSGPSDERCLGADYLFLLKSDHHCITFLRFVRTKNDDALFTAAVVHHYHHY